MSIEIPEGFTKWDGGECPVGPRDLVQVVFRDGDRCQGYAAGALRWDHPAFPDGYADADIIAYRVIENTSPTKA